MGLGDLGSEGDHQERHRTWVCFGGSYFGLVEGSDIGGDTRLGFWWAMDAQQRVELHANDVHQYP